MELSSPKLKKISHISGGTSKAPKTKIYNTCPKKVMNKFFQKRFRIIVSIFSVSSVCIEEAKTKLAFFKVVC